MKPEPSSAKHAASQDSERSRGTAIPFDIFSQNELLLWPYRSFSKTLLRAHHNTAELVQINRKLADELRQIIRRQQDFTLELTEKLLCRTEKGKGESASSPEAFNGYFDTVIAGVREFGSAVSEAQIHSLEALRDRGSEAMAAKAKAHPHAQAAE